MMHLTLSMVLLTVLLFFVFFVNHVANVRSSGVDWKWRSCAVCGLRRLLVSTYVRKVGVRFITKVLTVKSLLFSVARPGRDVLLIGLRIFPRAHLDQDCFLLDCGPDLSCETYYCACGCVEARSFCCCWLSFSLVGVLVGGTGVSVFVFINKPCQPPFSKPSRRRGNCCPCDGVCMSRCRDCVSTSVCVHFYTNSKYTRAGSGPSPSANVGRVRRWYVT